MEQIICDTIFKCVKVICILLALVFVIKFIQTLWLRYIERSENRRFEIAKKDDQNSLHLRKLETMEKQEEIRKFERLHEIELKKIK